MNFQYTVRDKSGVMIAKFSTEAFAAIITGVKGKWRNRTANGVTSTVYELLQDYNLNLYGCRFYLWSGSIIIPE